MELKVYYHINNGGVSIAIDPQAKHPTLSISANHMGHVTNRINLLTTREGIEYLREVCDLALEQEFSEEYCCSPSLFLSIDGKDIRTPDCSETDYEESSVGDDKKHTVEEIREWISKKIEPAVPTPPAPPVSIFGKESEMPK